MSDVEEKSVACEVVTHSTEETIACGRTVGGLLEEGDVLAIDAIGKDGRITITTAGTPGGGAQIAIADNGPGLDPETKTRIFDPFFTTKAVGEGTGLGLAISYSILQKLGGTIDCQSKVGVGTTFTISLPPEPPQALREQDEDEGGTPGL